MSLPDLPEVPDSRLPAEVVASLPLTSPAPPWRCRVEAVMWWHRAVPGVRQLLPDELLPGRAVTVAAFVRYLDSPVGPYEEVLASPQLLAGLLPHVHVPYIAVDSLAALHGGRVHWALPKTLAAFTRTPGRVRASGDGWSLAATAEPKGPWLPTWGRLRASQPDGEGIKACVTTARGRFRFAAVDVDSSLTSWLLPGSHHGAVLRGQVVVSSATRAGQRLA